MLFPGDLKCSGTKCIKQKKQKTDIADIYQPVVDYDEDFMIEKSSFL